MQPPPPLPPPRITFRLTVRDRSCVQTAEPHLAQWNICVGFSLFPSAILLEPFICSLTTKSVPRFPWFLPWFLPCHAFALATVATGLAVFKNKRCNSELQHVFLSTPPSYLLGSRGSFCGGSQVETGCRGIKVHPPNGAGNTDIHKGRQASIEVMTSARTNLPALEGSSRN